MVTRGNPRPGIVQNGFLLQGGYAVITIRGLKKTFRIEKQFVHAVNGVDLDISEGEIFGVVGYSGAGKSTLVRCINFLEIPEEGSITINGFGTFTARNGKLFHKDDENGAEKPATDKQLRQLRRNIGMIFQHFNLLDRSTVFENVAYPLQHTGKTKTEIAAKVRELLELVDLSDKIYSYPSELSGGQKQRVAIARALANDPKILLSDEATSALDPDVTESILKLLKDLNRKLGLTVILITHEMAVVRSICDRVAVMENGKVVEEGNVYGIFADPKENVTKRFVNASFGLSNLDKLTESGLVNITPDSKLVRLTFSQESVGEALISQVSRKFNVSLNIILANVEILQDAPLGALIILAKGDRADVENALKYIEEQNVKVEVIVDGMD